MIRILFSATRGSGHLEPLRPYARALVARNHEVVVAAPASASETLRGAGLAHAPFDHPGDDTLGPIWARFRGLSDDEVMAIAAREIFAGVNARVALPKLQATIDDWRPLLVVRDSVEFAALVAAERAGVSHARVAVHSVSFEEVLPALVDAPIDALRALSGLSPDEGASMRAEAVFSSFPRVARLRAGGLANAHPLSRARGRGYAELRARPVGARGRPASARLHHVRDNRRNHRARPLGLHHRARRRRGPARARAPHDGPWLRRRRAGRDPRERSRRRMDSSARRAAARGSAGVSWRFRDAARRARPPAFR